MGSVTVTCETLLEQSAVKVEIFIQQTYFNKTSPSRGVDPGELWGVDLLKICRTDV